MIEIADKDNKTVLTAFHMFKLKELSMLIVDTEDRKYSQIKLLDMKTTVFAEHRNHLNEKTHTCI